MRARYTFSWFSRVLGCVAADLDGLFGRGYLLVCSFEVLLRALLRSGLVGFWDFLVSGFGAGL